MLSQCRSPQSANSVVRSCCPQLSASFCEMAWMAPRPAALPPKRGLPRAWSIFIFRASACSFFPPCAGPTLFARKRLRKGYAQRARPQQRLAAFVDVNLGPTYHNHEHGALWIAFAVEALNDPDFARLLNVIRRREQSTLLHALRQIVPEPEATKVLLSLRATVEACRLWVGYYGWYDSTHATALTYSMLRQNIPDFDAASGT